MTVQLLEITCLINSSEGPGSLQTIPYLVCIVASVTVDIAIYFCLYDICMIFSDSGTRRIVT